MTPNWIVWSRERSSRGELNDEETEKFIREARAAAQLRHPNIISVHEVGREGDTPYIVCDFIEALSLHDWLTGQKMTYREAAELCATIAERCTMPTNKE